MPVIVTEDFIGTCEDVVRRVCEGITKDMCEMLLGTCMRYYWAHQC